MKRALVGSTGFVGSNLAAQRDFDLFFNSKNIGELGEHELDLLVIAAPSAVKWHANKYPDEDLAHVRALMQPLRVTRAKEVILFSTVDVYPAPFKVDEDTPIDDTQCQAYGLHRLQLEQFTQQTLGARIIRLPGLFGPGIKKNIIFDFLTGNETNKIDSRNQLQFYPLARIGADLDRFLATDIRTLNLACEPLGAGEVAEICTGVPYRNEVASSLVHYDFRSKYAERFGGRNGYLFSRGEVLGELRLFVESFRGQV